MSSDMSETEARLALEAVARRREQVVAEINVPGWYWWALAVGWLALGVLAQFAPPWATTVGTLAFGAAHASIAPRVLSGQAGSSRLRVRRELVGHRVAVWVVGFLLAMTGLTVGIALGLAADGAQHPSVVASGFVAALVLCGGPLVMANVRRLIARTQPPR